MMRSKGFFSRRTLTVFLLLILFSVILVAKGVTEYASDATTVRLALMQGPSGFAAAGLFRNHGELSPKVRVDIEVFPSPTEVIARLANGELDVAALPTNVAANLYNKGVDIQLVATVGEGMLALVGIDAGLQYVEDLAGETIYLPGAGSAPDQMSRLFLTALGYEEGSDIFFEYGITAPAQLAQMLIANKVSYAVLPEPFITMVLQGNPNLRKLVNIQDLWESLTGIESYPMTVVVASKSFITQHPEALQTLLSAWKESVHWVLTEPQEAGKVIEEQGIMKATLAIPAIPNCNLVYRSVAEGKPAIQDYLTNLFWFESASIGGAIPDAAFYLEE